MPQEYIIYSDESEESGAHFSNFYGGVLVRSEHIDEVRKTIADKKAELRFGGEVKWGKVTHNYVDKYKELMDCFFDLVEAGKIKVRIMFTQNTVRAKNLTVEQVEQSYFILYYMFIKLAFGLVHSPKLNGGVDLRIFPDQMPDTAEQVERFKSFLVALSLNSKFRQREIRILKENISEVVSHEHDVLQCLDIVLGAIQFRLNDKHLHKERGAKRRGKKTRAKLKVYTHINKRIRMATHPHFNVGITTGTNGDFANLWSHGYRHWLFKPTDSVRLPGSKRKKK